MAIIAQSSHAIVLKKIYDALYRHFGPQYWWPGDTPFEVAVGAVLTQNTNWTNVEKAINNLKKENVLDVQALRGMSHSRLASLIMPAGYFNVKTKRLMNFLSFLADHYRGSMKRMEKEDTAALREKLLKVNGIGPETADSILLYALNKPVFVIDAYTKRVLERHKIVSGKIQYHDLQRIFHDSLDHDVQFYNDYHALLVMLGKDYCRPKPKCCGCPLERMPIK